MYYNYGYGIDWTVILLIIGVIITLIAQSRVKSAYARYAKVQAASGLTGAETARRILAANGIYGVSVGMVSGSLTDHYDPAKKIVNLSEDIYGSRSIAAISVAAHECGHAIQDDMEYAPLRFRTSLVPVVNIGSQLSWPVIIVGLMIPSFGDTLVTIGILLFSLCVLFQLVTLPVEFDASSRAVAQLEGLGIVTQDEKKEAGDMLRAAAMTYVASAASAVLSLLRIILSTRGNRRR